MRRFIDSFTSLFCSHSPTNESCTMLGIQEIWGGERGEGRGRGERGEGRGERGEGRGERGEGRGERGEGRGERGEERRLIVMLHIVEEGGVCAT